MLSSCEKPVISDDSFTSEDGTDEVIDAPTKKFTFTLKGDFGSPHFMRAGGYLSADGQDMTDLWVLDYMDGALVGQLHQTAEDEDFGTPTMVLDFGSHHVYFVCSRGTTPTLSTEEHSITWATTSDTFYKDYSVSVTSIALRPPTLTSAV